MKVVILAGGLGTRISEESTVRPKPMVEIGGRPILWHIMKYYSHYGFNDFIICLGYKGNMIKEYFANYYLLSSDVTFDFRENNRMEIHNNVAEPWRVTLVDTGLQSQTGARLRRIRKYLNEESFLLTYGDGVSDVNLQTLVHFHQKQKSIVTMTAIQPGGRFGLLDIDKATGSVQRFMEKPKEDGGWINGGFMVVEPEVFAYLPEREDLIFEHEPLENLAAEGKLSAFRHEGFWQCMDTLRDKMRLERIWASGHAPWKVAE